MGNYIYILVILVSAVIGYITNFLAIKMLFHPYNEHKLFGKIRIPFTPGIIPKNRHRIAVSLASTMTEKIINGQAIKDEIVKSIEEKNYIDDFLSKNKVSTVLGDDYIKNLDNISNSLSSYIINKFIEGNYGKKIVDKLLASLIPKLGFLGSMLGGLGETVELQINEFVKNNGPEELQKIINEELKKIGESDLANLGTKLSVGGNNIIKKILTDVSSKFIDEMMKGIDLEKLIVKNIDLLDIKEFEQMILEVMKKELSAITWLGALLGGILGIVNIIFMIL